MSSEPDDLRRQVAELNERVAKLEARLAETPPATAERRTSFVPARAAAFAAEKPEASSVRSSGRSLESRIGSQLFNRVGIVAILIGVAWFLKFAIDNHWIGPSTRVLIGLIAGVGLIAWSERFRARGYSGFSLSLKAVGSGVLYLSLWAAFALFHLIPDEVAFVAMVLVTAWNAWMCWVQNSEALAFYAAVGGFITPMLLSNGESHELTLFTYLLVLDLAVLALIALRPWSRLLVAAFAGTVFYALGWYWSFYTDALFPLTVSFVLAFFLLFAAGPQLLRSLRMATRGLERSVEDVLVLVLLPFVNAAVAFFELYALMSPPRLSALRAWIALPFAAFYLVLARLSRLRALSGTPARLPATYLVLGVLFITGAIPLEAHGRWIAILWFVEFAALTWLATRRELRSLRILATWVLAVGFLAILTPIHFFNPPASTALILNSRFGTYLVAIAATAFATWVASSAETKSRFAAMCGIAATVLIMIAVCMEIHAYWSATPGVSYTDEQFSYSAWSMIFGAVLLAAGFWRKSAFLRWEALVLLALSVGKVFLVDVRQLTQGYRILSFLGLGALLLTVSFAYQKDWLNLRSQSAK